MDISRRCYFFRKLKNTEYAITDKGIYSTNGCFSKQYNFKPFTDLSHVYIHRGIFDQFFNVGDVQLTTNQFTNKGTPAVIALNSISDYANVYRLVKKLQRDIYADTMYPNDLRPEENHGYRTKYRG